MEFELLNHTFIITLQQENYAKVAAVFTDIHDRTVIRFYDDYKAKYPTIENWGNDIYQRVGAPLDMAARDSVAYLRKNGVYTITEEEFFNRGFDSRCLADKIEAITQQLEAIECNAKEAAQYREARKQNRTRAVGFGFGMKNYVKASMQAGAINMATGLAHSMANGIGNSASDAAASRKMTAIIKSSDTIDGIAKLISSAVDDMKKYAIQILNSETNVKCLVITDNEVAKSDAVMRSVEHIPEAEKRKALIQALELNILNKSAYAYIVNNYPEEMHKADLMATHFGIDVSDPIKQSINFKTNQLLHLTMAVAMLTFKPYTDIQFVLNKYEDILKDIDATEWDEQTLNSRLDYSRETVDKCVQEALDGVLDRHFDSKDELFKAAQELEKFYIELNKVDLLDELVYMETKIHMDKYEYLNFYGFEILYNAMNLVRALQENPSETISQMMPDTITDKPTSVIGKLTGLHVAFLFPQMSKEFEKDLKNVIKYLPLNPGENVICITHFVRKQCLVFSNQRVIAFDHSLFAKKQCGVNLEDVQLFDYESGHEITLKSKKEVVDDIGFTPENAALCKQYLNVILNSIKMHIKGIEPGGVIPQIENSQHNDRQPFDCEQKDEMMFCPYCGKKIRRMAKFCSYCGKGNTYNK